MSLADPMSPVVKWESYLPDRIESTACVSSDGKYVIVGCYDHFVYVLRSDDGGVEAKFETGDMVKSEIKWWNGAWLGSYDGYLYWIGFNDGVEVKWKRDVGGPILGGIGIDKSRNSVIVCTLRGKVECLGEQLKALQGFYGCEGAGSNRPKNEEGCCP